MSNDNSGLPVQLAAQIAAHVRRKNLPPGAHLTEQVLANAFEVSRSPVRSALALLAAQGVLKHEPNRGYFLKTPPASRRNLPPAAWNEADSRYLRIADDRLAGRVEGHVTEAALMRRYDVPRRELQRILHRMENEGWIERKPGHGWKFVEMPNTVEAHDQSYRFRMMIEPAALLEPGFRVNRAELDRLRRDQRMLLDAGVHKLSRSALFEMGSDFHETLMGFSGNRFIIDTIRRVNSMRRLLEYRAKYDRERFAQQCCEHLHLLDLLENGSREDAACYLRRHLDVVRASKTAAGSLRGQDPDIPSAQL